VSGTLIERILSDEQAMRENILKHCQEANIVCADLLPYLRAELGRGVKIYKENWDEHPAELGYKKYANAIADYLFKNSLIK
jgi:hypothetical protein